MFSTFSTQVSRAKKEKDPSSTFSYRTWTIMTPYTEIAYNSFPIISLAIFQLPYEHVHEKKITLASSTF